MTKNTSPSVSEIFKKFRNDDMTARRLRDQTMSDKAEADGDPQYVPKRVKTLQDKYKAAL